MYPWPAAFHIRDVPRRPPSGYVWGMRESMRISRRRGMVLLARVVGAGAIAPLLAGAAPPSSHPSPGLRPQAPSTTGPALPAAIRDALATSAAAIDPITLRWTNRAHSTDQI